MNFVWTLQFTYCSMILTNQIAKIKFKCSAVFLRWKSFCCYIFVSPLACSVLRSKGQSFQNTFSRIKVKIWLVTIISTEHNQQWGVIRSSMLSSVNRGLTLVRLGQWIFWYSLWQNLIYWRYNKQDILREVQFIHFCKNTVKVEN